MIRDFGVEQNEVAKWAGLTSAVFSLAQSITAVPWGKASDRFGRKPALICGLISTMICFIIWGMSTSLPMAIAVRAIQGGGNGNGMEPIFICCRSAANSILMCLLVGIIRTMVAELVPQKELQPRAFSIMPLVWSLGSVVGPAFGGFFAHPAQQFPSVFGNIEYFKRFPYALPNLMATIFFLISATSATLFLKVCEPAPFCHIVTCKIITDTLTAQETLEEKRGNSDWGILVGQRLTRAFQPKQAKDISHRRTSFVDGEATAPLVPSQVRSRTSFSKKRATGMKEVFTPQTVINLASYTFLAFHSVAYDQNITVFLDYPVIPRTPENTKFPFYFTGGFGLDSGTIGTIFTVYGIACGLIQFILYPPLVSRFGVLNCYRVCSESPLSLPLSVDTLTFTHPLLPF